MPILTRKLLQSSLLQISTHLELADQHARLMEQSRKHIAMSLQLLAQTDSHVALIARNYPRPGCQSVVRVDPHLGFRAGSDG